MCKILHRQIVFEARWARDHTVQMSLKSVRSEGICPKGGWGIQLQSTEVLVGLLSLKAELK